jgi:polar amino acid transport system substrate-binding protein
MLAFAIQLYSTTVIAAPEPVNICEDAGGWPPFIYQPPESPALAPAGLSVDIADIVFKKLNLNYRITLLPWKRCLHEVEKGNRYVMILNASFNKQRAAMFHFTQAYYEIKPYYFYSRKTHPNGLDIGVLKDLHRFRVGGILGYNYSYYGLADDQIINTGIYNLEALLGRLHGNQYDLVLENYEVVAGFFLLRDAMREFATLGAAPVPELPPTPFHMIFSKTPDGLILHRKVDAVLSELKQTGIIEKIINARLSVNPASSNGL